MHYVHGHEVGAYITQEVTNLALSTTVNWNKVGESGPCKSYSCQVGNIVATKVVDEFDCSAEILAHCISKINNLFGPSFVTILEEYDECNQIILAKTQFPPLPKLVRCCLYRYSTVDRENQRYYTVYQSVDHDAMTENEDDDCIPWLYAPTGFLITPFADDPSKCHMIYVSQVPDMEQLASPEFIQSYCATAGSLGRLWQELKKAVLTYPETVTTTTTPFLHTMVENMRRVLYESYFELSPSHDWKLLVHTWVDVFTKEEKGKLHIALRSCFFSPESCKQVASRLYEALRHSYRWNRFVTDSVVLEELGEGACVVLNQTNNIDTGIMGDSIHLIACKFNVDGVCDVSLQSIEHEKAPLMLDRSRMVFPVNGFIISPNGHGSTIQWMLRPPVTTVENGHKVPCGRVINYLNGIRNYVTCQTGSGLDSPPIQEYHQALEAFSTLALCSNETVSTDSTLPLAKPTRKRKIGGPTLVSVENMVLKITPGVYPTRPFLFLVPNSNDGQRHRFVRRKWASHSIFDLLPEELLEHALSFLDGPSLLRIPLICSRFNELLGNMHLWYSLYLNQWGVVAGRVAQRYCGDDDPATFFTSSFPHWRELYWERHLIECAWVAPERRAHGFRVAGGHARAIRTVALLPRSHRLVTGSHDKLVRVWDALSGACLTTIPGASGVVALGVAEVAKVKAGYKSGVVRLLDIDKGESEWEIRLAESMRGCMFLRDRIVTWDEEVELWDEHTQARMHSFNGHMRHITDCAYSTQSSILYSASRDKTVKLWDMNSDAKIATITGHTRGVNGIALIGDHLCVSVSGDKSMRVWDIRKAEAPLLVQTMHTGKIKCIKYTETGKKICTGGMDGVRIWRSDTFQHIRWDQTEEVESLAVDEERMAYGAMSGVLRFFDFVPHGTS